jgi:glycosyltransferase involved in cell wall biosynthesis
LQSSSSSANDATAAGLALSERALRVLVVASHPVQYSAPIFRLMAQHRKLDFHVAYCSLRGAEAGHDPEFGRSVQWDIPLLNGYSWTHVQNRGSGSESFFGLYNPGLWKLIRQGGFDAVLCFTGYIRASFWISYFAAKLSHTAFLFGADAVTLSPMDGRKWKRPVKRLLWPVLFRLSDQVMVPSSGTRDLMRSLGISERRITLTPYVVDNDWWLTQSARVDREPIRTSWGASLSDVVVLFCAKLQPWKRPHDLLHAFSRAGLKNAVLVFAGDGPLRANLELEAAKLGIADRVRFPGFVNQTQLPAIYTAADLMVLPSGYDAFGVVVNEAMLCGCVVAASDRVGAARDLVIHERTGFVYPCGDVEALTRILAKALADMGRLREIGRAARQRLESWSPRENVEGTVDAIATAVSRLRRDTAPEAQA